MLERIKGKIIISVALGALIFIALSVLADFDNLVGAFKQFNWLYLPIIFALSLSNYAIRFAKWDYYVHCLRIDLPKRELGDLLLWLCDVCHPRKDG